MDERSGGRPRPDEVEQAGLSPVRAFFVVGAVLVATVVGFVATREPTPATPTAKPSGGPDYSLTDEEAIAEFERLHALLTSAYEQRDPSLVKLFAAPDSNFARKVEHEILSLVRDGVLDVTLTRVVSQDVLASSPQRVEIEQVVVERPRFKDEQSGRDLTLVEGAQRQTVVWTLKLTDGRWVITRAVITAAEPLEAPDA